PVGPPPTSARAPPTSCSSSVSTADDAASGSSTRSATRYPARCTALRRFCAAVLCTVTRYISTSSRVPVIPTGSTMPRCWSTTYSCGMSCSNSLSRPSDTARATSFTRPTSEGATSSPVSATTPVEVRADTCSPAMPQVTSFTTTPAIRPASRPAAPTDPSAPALAPHDHLPGEARVELRVGPPFRREILRYGYHRPNDLQPGVAPHQHTTGPRFQEHVAARHDARGSDRLKQRRIHRLDQRQL